MKVNAQNLIERNDK